MNFIVTGIGAGLVSALLTAVVVKATALAAILYALAPIPVLIVSLGWNHRSGLVAAIVGGLTIGALLSPMSGLSFAIVTGLPSWWLSYLTLLGRQDSNGAIEWYPLGRLLAWIAGTATLTVAAVAIVGSGDFQAFHDDARKASTALIDLYFPAKLPTDEALAERESLIVWLAYAVPAMLAMGFTVTLSLYLWAAAKIVSVSGRLPRPWTPLPDLLMPRNSILFVLLGSAFIILPLTRDSIVGILCVALVGAFLTAFALQGLASLHARTRGKVGRAALLTGIYILLVVLPGVVLPPLSLFGIVDSVFQLPRRSQPGKPDTKSPQNPST
ncbi:DUF2232 domain-containing protein [Microvirga sp. 2MCAF38]|uniref:DUF2232 domain-containing protein n=1 Tax=Microvirga sp. 2MCAF38 TaxID=3232989 RepID=UPI003F9778EF